jgi:hypothetical protein
VHEEVLGGECEPEGRYQPLATALFSVAGALSIVLFTTQRTALQYLKYTSASQPLAVSSHGLRSRQAGTGAVNQCGTAENVVSPRRSQCPSRKTHRKGSKKVQCF